MRFAMPLPDLASPAPIVPPPLPDPDLVEAARAAAMAEGHARGFAEGLAEGARRQREAQEASIASSLGLVAAALEDAGAVFARAAEMSAEALAATLLTAFDAALPGAAARHGPEVAASLAVALLPALTNRPEARLLVAPDQVAAVTARVPTCLAVVGDDALAPGDARIAWRDGAQAVSTAARREAVRAVLALLSLRSGEEE